MLEKCTDLLACEIVLSDAVKSVRLLDEITLLDEDIELLASLVRQKISTSTSKGTAYFRTKSKTSFVCFLVGMGRFYDKQAGYWPIVEMKVGEIDLNWKVKWGKFFIQYLVDNGLPRFDEEEGLTYVTPILSHACIPDCCMDEYFDKVLAPLVQHDLFNPLDQQEIIHDLLVKRKINASRLELEKKKNKKNDLLEVLEREYIDLQNRLDKYKDVVSLLEKEEECKRKKIALKGLEDADLARQNLENCINEVTRRIAWLEAEGNRLWEIIKEFKQRFQPILKVKPQIDDVISNYERLNHELPEALAIEKGLYSKLLIEWYKQSEEPWNDSFGSEIIQLTLEDLFNQIVRYINLQEEQKVVLEKIRNLETKQNEANKPAGFMLSLQKFFIKTLGWIGRKSVAVKPSELEQLQRIYQENKVQLQSQLTNIKELVSRLPVEEKELDNPTLKLYEWLSFLKAKYIDYIGAQQNRIKLEEQFAQLTEQIRNLASCLGISVSEDVNSLVIKFREILKEAQKKRIGAVEAQRILESEIKPALSEAQLEYQKLQTELQELDQRLAEIGCGSAQEGLRLVREFHQYQVEVVQIRQKLSSQFSDLQTIENELHTHGWDPIRRGFDEAFSTVKEQMQAAQSDLKQINHDITKYPAQYISIDEPIRSFLLYGGLTAENYLCGCVTLFARAKAGERVEDVSTLHIPDRIIQHFKVWWEAYQASLELKSHFDEEACLATGERYRAPQIFLSWETGEIIARLPTQRLLRPEHGTTAKLDVYSDNTSHLIYTTSLKLYMSSRGLVDTHACDDIVLIAPSEKYIFQLKNKDDLIHEWEILGTNERIPLLAFSRKSYKLIRGDTFPRSPLILVINKTLCNIPQDCILTEGGYLFGDWNDYAWYEVDLSTIEDFYISYVDGHRYTILLSSEFGSNITFLGGNQLSGISSDERPIYNLPPEYIRIPITGLDELHLVRLSIYWGDEGQTRNSKHYQIDELKNLINTHEEGWVDIPLDVEELLGMNPIGSFTLRVYKPPYLDWQHTFCILPKLTASFDQEIYLPFSEKIPNVVVTLTIPESSTFKPDSPAKLVLSDRKSLVIETPASDNEIIGLLICSTGNKERINIPITLSIPKLRWRIQGLEDPLYSQWSDEVQEELWIGDWISAPELFLIVQTPWFYNGNVSLSLPGNSVAMTFENLHNQKFRVDLKALEDTLRMGPSLEKVNISLEDARIIFPNITIFTVRTCWLAEKIKCFYYPEGDKVQLDVSWEEKGKANQKDTRLWYLSNNQPRLTKHQLMLKDEHKTTFISSTTEIKPGKYLIHIIPHDPWSSNPICPNPDDQNTAIIDIVSEAPEKTVTIRSLRVDKFHNYFLRQGAYRIHIIGKVINQKLPDNLAIEDVDHVLITPLNENWYVGNLEVKGFQEVITHLSDTNPVKFEYDTDKKIVTSIVDRHGDGAVYCYECGALFWCQETVLSEKNKKHRNYGPIEMFWVDWESD